MSYSTVYDPKQKRNMVVDELGRERPEWHSDLDKGTPQPFRDHPRILYKAGGTKRVETPAEEATWTAKGWGRAVDHGMAVADVLDEVPVEAKRGPGRPKKDAAA